MGVKGRVNEAFKSGEILNCLKQQASFIDNFIEGVMSGSSLPKTCFHFPVKRRAAFAEARLSPCTQCVWEAGRLSLVASSGFDVAPQLADRPSLAGNPNRP